MIGMKPVDGIRAKSVAQKSSLPICPQNKVKGKAIGRPQDSAAEGGDKGELPPSVNVRYLFQPGEIEGRRRRVTNPLWSLKV